MMVRQPLNGAFADGEQHGAPQQRPPENLA